MKRILALACVICGVSFGAVLPAQAAPVTLPDGSVFDPDYYAAMNPDVVITVGTDAEALYAHYLRYGQKEGRAPAAPADVISHMDPTVFDAAYYAARYPDVVASFGADARVLQWHYLYWGKEEGRFPNVAAESQAVQATAKATAANNAAGSGNTAGTQSQQKNNTNTAQQAAIRYSYIHKVQELLNDRRKKEDSDLGKLTWSEGLEAAADIRAREIASYMSHERPDGTKFTTAIADSKGNFTEIFASGEGTPEDVVDYWMKDGSYRKTILSDDNEKVGIGYYNVNGRTFWIGIFCDP
ncbi:MAG: CAP domain-containing protein [Lachnospiraceae bacterium]|nr:CAP domain-containing protein [Lachnospiraceae bacterium]